MTPKLIVLSNRGPVRRDSESEVWSRSDGGLVTALHPVLKARDGIWVFSADEEEAAALRDAPKGSIADVSYDLAAVELTPEQRRGFYEDVANGILWPLLHSFQPTTRVGEAPWSDYTSANRMFAEAAYDAHRGRAMVWIHDYHLMLAPGYLRALSHHANIGWFCHIPWPGVELFGILPRRRELLEGLLGADLIGFHTAIYVRNFLECVERLTDCNVDHARSSVRFNGRTTRVIAAPIGVPVADFERLANDESVAARSAAIAESVMGRRVILGVDRLDYTKGIPERILAYGALLERRPELAEETVMVQIMVPSRTDVDAYAALKEEVDRLVGQINGSYGTTGRVPIHYMFTQLDRADLVAHYRTADVALVSPLRDGMNLVAQEFVASRTDERGALVLSEFAGAAEYLREAIMVNAYDVSGMSHAIERALAMPEEERRTRMRMLRAEVARLDVHTWANRHLELLELGVRQRPRSTPP